jgi:hypothetical protein
MGTGVLSKGKSVQDVILTRHFSLQTRLNISGTIILLRPYSSMVWIGINVIVVAVVFVVVQIPLCQ